MINKNACCNFFGDWLPDSSFLDLEQCTFASLMSISNMAENVVTETKLHSSTTRMFTL